MKKVLSVAMASAMVLGMGANAFAIQYGSGSNDKAEWPKNFKFEGQLFVTDKDDNIVKGSTTLLNDNEPVNFQPGDVIWMPLYADNQRDYTADITKGEDAVESYKVSLREGVDYVEATDEKMTAYYDATAKKWYDVKGGKDITTEVNTNGWKNIGDVTSGDKTLIKAGTTQPKVTVPTEVDVTIDGVTKARKVVSATVVVDGVSYTGTPAELNTKFANSFFTTDSNMGNMWKNGYSISGTVVTESKDATDTTVGKPKDDNTTAGVILDRGHYTGDIDKNWSINLIEKDGTVSDLIEKAELYKATATDYASYKDVTNEIEPNAVYLKISLKKEWKTTDKETLKYYVYLSNNKNNADKTNQVWVSGKYEASYRTVDFTWTNNANEAALWKAEDNGTAVFDFADKAFFTVKMYKGETMYLDLETAYDKVIAGEMDVDADSFYKFDKANANFARAGELVIVTDDDTLVPYEIDEDGNFVELDAEYVENYLIKNSNKKVNGFKFETKQLGNYVLSTEELGAEEEVEEEEAPEVDEEEAPEVDEEPAPETNKPNPETGAEDFVGLAVSLAVVSVAAAGALALKK